MRTMAVLFAGAVVIEVAKAVVSGIVTIVGMVLVFALIYMNTQPWGDREGDRELD